MRILVTGATGFIGRSLVGRLSERHDVVALVRDAARLHVNSHVTAIHTDLLVPLDEERLPREIDAIVHLAQHNGVFPHASRELFAVNTARTQELLDYARHCGARQFVYASSGDVYGYRLDACSETDPANPVSFYAVTKYSSELLVRAYAAFFAPTVLRLFTPHGPGQTGRLVPTLATRIAEGKPVRLNQGNRPLLTPTFIEDVIDVFEHVVTECTAGTFNVAGNTVMSVRDLAATLGRFLGKEPFFEETGENVGSLIGDNSSVKNVLGIVPLTEFNQGLERTISTLRR